MWVSCCSTTRLSHIYSWCLLCRFNSSHSSHGSTNPDNNLICIAKWTTMGSKPFYQSRQGKSCCLVHQSNSDMLTRSKKQLLCMHDPHSRESQGFSFVTMETTEKAETTITQLYRCYGPNNQGKKWATQKLPISYMSDILGLWWTGSARTPTPGHYCGLPREINVSPLLLYLMYNWWPGCCRSHTIVSLMPLCSRLRGQEMQWWR